jgi:O-glycosyl hydrolase
MRCFAWIAFWIVLGLGSTAVADPPLTFQLDRTSHRFSGLGAQVWAGDLSVEPVLRDLHLQFVRLCIDAFKSPIDVEGWGDQEYDRYFQKQQWLPYHKTWDLLQKYHIDIIANVFGAPANWKTDHPRKNSLDPKFYPHYAKRLAAALASLWTQGIRPIGIEMFNEPDGDWDCYVPPKGYNQLVKLLRAELDARGLQQLLIVGPGVAHIDTGNKEPWIDALDEQGARAVGIWSIHGYQWDHAKNQAPQFARDSFLAGFAASYANKADPTAKPVYITEYAPYGCFGKQEHAIDKPEFAARTVSDALSFLNCGANAVSFWQAADMPWARKHDDGLINLHKTPRPVYYALQSVFAHWPVGGQILRSSPQPADGIYGAAVYAAKTQTVVISLANCTATARSQTVIITGMKSPRLVGCEGFDNGTLAGKHPVFTSPEQFTIELPASGTSPRYCRTKIESIIHEVHPVVFGRHLAWDHRFCK